MLEDAGYAFWSVARTERDGSNNVPRISDNYVFHQIFLDFDRFEPQYLLGDAEPAFTARRPEASGNRDFRLLRKLDVIRGLEDM